MSEIGILRQLISDRDASCWKVHREEIHGLSTASAPNLIVHV